MRKPAFLAFTGVDRVELLPGMRSLSQRYPIEWGILVKTEARDALFPSAALRQHLLQARELRFSAHLCGVDAEAVAGGQKIDFDPAGFARIQINHGRTGSTAEQIAHARDFGRTAGIRVVLQTIDRFPEDPSVEWLYDTSFGTGKTPSSWPPLPSGGGFCGYSGGLGPGSIVQAMDLIAEDATADYWLDMESGVRSEGYMDIEKCAAVCRYVFDLT